jgi:peptidoglycan hydrolase-like protein with peptidoglycan-binding domain
MLGSTGDEVAELHGVLIAIGLHIDLAETESSSFGPSTARAIRRVQEICGLAVTGILDARTCAVIVASARRPDVEGNAGDDQAGPVAVSGLAVVVHVEDVGSGCAAGDRQVRSWPALPPRADLLRLGGGVAKTVPGCGFLGAGSAREYRPGPVGLSEGAVGCAVAGGRVGPGPVPI